MDKLSQESSRSITLLQNQISELERLVHLQHLVLYLNYVNFWGHLKFKTLMQPWGAIQNFLLNKVHLALLKKVFINLFLTIFNKAWMVTKYKL